MYAGDNNDTLPPLNTAAFPPHGIQSHRSYVLLVFENLSNGKYIPVTRFSKQCLALSGGARIQDLISGLFYGIKLEGYGPMEGNQGTRISGILLSCC